MSYFQRFRKKLSKKGQNAIEYMLLFAVATGAIVFAFSPGGVFDQNVTQSIDTAIDAFECTAQTACFDPSCSPVCGNGCCEINEGLGEPNECYQDCGFPCPPDPLSVTCSGSIQCGLTTNNCGDVIDCGGCPGGLACSGNTCLCIDEPLATTCSTIQCGPATNNCGNPVNCGGCPGGFACLGNVCQCVDEPLATTCAGVPCGDAVNNCGNTVTCPDTCVLPQTCQGNTCSCIDDPVSTTCAAIECGSVANNCGSSVACPNTCVAPDVCVGNTCQCISVSPCGPGACGLQVDNCGNTVDCGPDCGCYELAATSPYGVPPCTTNCPNLGTTTCQVAGEECIVCQQHPATLAWRRITYRCDPLCDNSCVPNNSLAPYPCFSPAPFIWDYGYLCGTPNDRCGTPIVSETCGTCGPGLSCSYLDSDHSQCLASSCIAQGGTCASLGGGYAPVCTPGSTLGAPTPDCIFGCCTASAPSDCSASTNGLPGTQCSLPAIPHGATASGVCDFGGTCSGECSDGVIINLFNGCDSPCPGVCATAPSYTPVCPSGSLGPPTVDCAIGCCT